MTINVTLSTTFTTLATLLANAGYTGTDAVESKVQLNTSVCIMTCSSQFNLKSATDIAGSSGYVVSANTNYPMNNCGNILTRVFKADVASSILRIDFQTRI